jgi:hypothetical protein
MLNEEHQEDCAGNLTVSDVIEDFKRYVRQTEFNSGGSLHLVLDDFNIEDSNVQYCINSAIEYGDEEGTRLGRILLSMSRTQRLKIAKECWK